MSARMYVLYAEKCWFNISALYVYARAYARAYGLCIQTLQDSSDCIVLRARGEPNWRLDVFYRRFNNIYVYICIYIYIYIYEIYGAFLL